MKPKRTIEDIERHLRLACLKGNLGLVEKLLQCNPNLNATDDEGIALIVDAALGGNKKIVQILLEAGADVGPAMQYQADLREEGLEDIANYLFKVWRTGRTKSAEESKQIRQKARRLCPIKKHDVEIVKQWLETAQSAFPINVVETSIAPIRPPQTKQKLLYKIFTDAFDDAESKQHGFLKWFALMGFLRRDVIPQQYKAIYKDFWYYEAHIEIPPQLGNKKKGKGCVRPKGFRFPAYGRIIRADVIAGEYSIECGITRAENLIEPIACDVVGQTMWIPFVGNDQNEDWTDFESKIPAYQISRA